MGSMTTATAPAMRDEAERLLRELAGPDARLREDQWTAIEALVVQRKRALDIDPIEALAGDSDGIDGTEDNAGGYITASWADPQAAGQALAVNRSYDLFERLGGLIKTGPTRTNVNDIRMIAVEGQRA